MPNEIIDLEKLREEAQSAFNSLQDIGKHQGKLILVTGQILKDIRDRKLYKYLGEGGFDTFQSFLATPELQMKISTAYAYIDVYTYYVEVRKMPIDEVAQIPFYRLNQLMGYLKRQNDDTKAQELIEEVKVLSAPDFNQRLLDKKVIDVRPVTIFKHKDCGKYCIEYPPESICICAGSQYIKPIIR